MGAAQADDADLSAPICPGDAVGYAVDQAIKAEPRFIEPAVIDIGQQFEIGGPPKGNAVLFDVGGILGRVELDFHMVYVDANTPPLQSVFVDAKRAGNAFTPRPSFIVARRFSHGAVRSDQEAAKQQQGKCPQRHPYPEAVAAVVPDARKEAGQCADA